MLHFCHITNLTGQIFPVRDICRAGARARHPHDRGRRARLRALPVQGRRPRVRLLRHQPAQVAARAGRHRVPLRPRPLVKTIWPLTPANEKLTDDIRKFEEIGTHPGGQPQRDRRSAGVPPGDRRRAQGGAAAVSEGPLGPPPRVADRARGSSPASIRRSPAQSATCPSRGRIPPSSRHTSGARHRIFVTPIKHEEFEGIRVTPNLYTTLNEIDTFSQAIDEVLARGIPTS